MTGMCVEGCQIHYEIFWVGQDIVADEGVVIESIAICLGCVCLHISKNHSS